MAYGNYRATAMQDGVSSKRTRDLADLIEWNAQNNPTQAQAAVNRDYQAQLQREAEWNAQQLERQRQERVNDAEAAAASAPRGNAVARKQQEREDLYNGVGQQEDYSNAWQNLIQTPQEDLVSNGQTIQNRQTGEQINVPNRSQAQRNQISAEPETPTVTPNWFDGLIGPRVNVPRLPETQNEETTGTTGTPRRTASDETNLVTPAAGTDYTDEEIAQMQRDRTNLVVPRIYDPREQTQDANAGIPISTNTPAQTYYDWQNYLAQLEAAEQANDELFRQSVQPNTSVLGNGYVRPVTPQLATTPVTPQLASDTLGGAAMPVLPGAQAVRDSQDTARELADLVRGAGINLSDLSIPDTNAYIDALMNRSNALDQANGLTGNNGLNAPVLSGNDPMAQFADLFETPVAPAETGLGVEQQNDYNAARYRDYLDAWQRRQESIDNALARQGTSETAPVSVNIDYPLSDLDAIRFGIENGAPVASDVPGVGSEQMADYLASLGDMAYLMETPEEKRDRLDRETAELTSSGWTPATPSATSPMTPTTLTYNWRPYDYSQFTESRNPNIGRDSTPVWDTMAEQRRLYQEGYAEALGQPGWTETDRRAYAQYYADQKGGMNALFSNGGEDNGNVFDAITRYPAAIDTASGESGSPLEQVLDDIVNGTTGTTGASGSTTSSPTGTPSSTTGTTTSTAGTPKTYEEALQQYLAETGKNFIDLDESDYMAIRKRTGNNNSSTQVQNVVATATANKPPKGSTTFTPSYGQDMKQGVKAPYKAGGYTTAELQAMGNKPYKGANGYDQYEGYYYWNGKWYPVDQEKAAYYLQNGTYNGWDEGMRDYYNTFGTFYGYRPDWKTAGRNTSNYSYSRGGNSYSYNGSGYSPYYNPTTKNQQDQRINNIMKNWTF